MRPRVLLVGTIDFSHFCLSRLLDLPVEIAEVITDAPERNTFNTDFRDLRPLAQSAGIPVRTIFEPRDPAFLREVQQMDLDAILVVGWSRLIPAEFLNTARFGGIGSHPAPLPHGRGRHPLVWTLIEELNTGGLSFFKLTEEADQGPILLQETFRVGFEDDAGTLYNKIKEAAGRLLPTLIQELATGEPTFTPQDESAATVWRKRTEDDGLIRWDDTARRIYNLVRALSHPYVGAHTFYDEQRVRVWKALPPFHEVLDPLEWEKDPGVVLSKRGGRVRVRCGDGCITLVDLDEDERIISDLVPGSSFSRQA